MLELNEIKKEAEDLMLCPGTNEKWVNAYKNLIATINVLEKMKKRITINEK